MTRFTVIWRREADNELAEVWLQARDRAAVSNASGAIDRALAEDPAEKGTPAGRGFFTLVIEPLAVLYAVNDDDRIVRVEMVRELPDASGPSAQASP